MRVPPDPSKPLPRTRKSLNATVRESFETLPDARQGPVTVPMGDAAMSSYAMFALKDPSLLAFDKRRQKGDPNLHSIYKIGTIPCDTQMREVLGPVDPDALRPAFKALFNQAQRGKALEPFRFLNGCYLLSLDGTEFYRSDKVSSPACMKRVHKNENSGTLTI